MTGTLYTRNPDGTLTRHDLVTNCEFADGGIAYEGWMYRYKENLTSWPESVIYWMHEYGQSNGIAI